MKLTKDEFFLFHQSRFQEPPSNQCGNMLQNKFRENEQPRQLPCGGKSKSRSPPWQQSLRRDIEPGNRSGGRYARIIQQFRASVNSLQFEKKVVDYCRDPNAETPAMMSYCERLKEQAAKQRRKRLGSDEGSEKMAHSPSLAASPANAKHMPDLGNGLSSDVDSLLQQIAILKAASGLTDVEVAWRMLSSQGDAYVIASTKLEEAETSYERALHESNIARAQIETISCPAFEKMAKKLHERLHVQQERANNPTIEDVSDACLDRPTVADGYISIRTLVLDDDVAQVWEQCKLAWEEKGKPADGVGKALKLLEVRCDQEEGDAADEDLTKECAADRVVRQCVFLSEQLRGQVVEAKRRLQKWTKEAESALGDMELWRKRQEEAPEAADHEAADERQWASAHEKGNHAALQVMRRLMPIQLPKMSIDQVQQAALYTVNSTPRSGSESIAGLTSSTLADGSAGPVGGGVPYPTTLVLRLQKKKMLHWLIMPAHKIARSNFLQGCEVAHFTNLGEYDLTELRAIYSILPTKFELDNDGAKASWRRCRR
jgi:hypothetical protein